MARMIESICKVIGEQHVTGPDSLRDYHAARKVRDSLRIREFVPRYSAVRDALKNYRVLVSITPDGRIRVSSYGTRAEVILGK